MQRINKYLARCGVASRRSADNLVTEGRVTVNGEVIDTPGYMIDETSDKLRVDGHLVRPRGKHTYILLNKPAGYLTSRSDPHHKRTIIDLLAGLPAQVNPVGRLDLDSEGALLLTDDGELAFRLTHPRYNVKKIYEVTVKGRVTKEKLAALEKGIKLPDGKIGKARAKIGEFKDETTILWLELAEGRKREVKHLCRAIGHPVICLKRVSFAGIDCRNLEKGVWRLLTESEVAKLHTLVKLK